MEKCCNRNIWCDTQSDETKLINERAEILQIHERAEILLCTFFLKFDKSI